MDTNPYKCSICGKESSSLIQTHYCSRGITNRDFDQKDQQYRIASSPDQTTGKEGFTLHADYDRKNHLYTFGYRGQNKTVKESDITWETYPMNILAEIAAEFIKSVDKEIGWDWEPNEKKLSHGEILAQLESVVKR